jgi:hypothetical protein
MPESPWTVERHLAGRPGEVSDLYSAFARALATCGPFEVSVSKTAIAFKGERRGFAGVTPTASGLSGFIDLQRRVESPRFSRVSPYTKRLFVHRFRLTSPQELDDEFMSWLREAYKVGAGAHLESAAVER